MRFYKAGSQYDVIATFRSFLPLRMRFKAGSQYDVNATFRLFLPLRMRFKAGSQYDVMQRFVRSFRSGSDLFHQRQRHVTAFTPGTMYQYAVYRYRIAQSALHALHFTCSITR